jgi:hypothetical protein
MDTEESDAGPVLCPLFVPGEQRSLGIEHDRTARWLSRNRGNAQKNPFLMQPTAGIEHRRDRLVDGCLGRAQNEFAQRNQIGLSSDAA